MIRKDRLKRRRYSVTLIEMVIVMILIATITGALALNYQHSLDRGRQFATQQRIERLQAILTLYFAQNPDQINNRTIEWEAIIDASGLGPPKASDLLHDDWGSNFQISVDNSSGDLRIHIDSPATRRLNLST